MQASLADLAEQLVSDGTISSLEDDLSEALGQVAALQQQLDDFKQQAAQSRVQARFPT